MCGHGGLVSAVVAGFALVQTVSTAGILLRAGFSLVISQARTVWRKMIRVGKRPCVCVVVVVERLPRDQIR
jgi:hypothetical protein